MRTLLLILAFISFITLKAQTQLPLSTASYMQPGTFMQHNNLLSGDSNHLNKKWFVSTYAGISAGVVFFNGQSATFLSAPVSLQLNRRLNNNLYAFGAVTAAPTYFNFNRPLGTDKNYPGTPWFNSNSLGIQTSVSAGLMYINDDRTFSISGSVGIGRSSYPFYQPHQPNTQKQQLVTGSRQ